MTIQQPMFGMPQKILIHRTHWTSELFPQCLGYVAAFIPPLPVLTLAGLSKSETFAIFAPRTCLAQAL